jgi:hypothetical protein
MTNAQELQKTAQSLLDLQHDSLTFVRRMFGIEPDAWQVEALQALDRGENVVIRSGHGPGKTTLLAWMTMQTLACFPYSKIPCTAPTQHQLSDLLWAEISRWLRRSKLRGYLNWTATKLGVTGYEEAWFAVARACSDANNLAGFHAPKLRYIVDEAAGVPENIFEVIDGALTTPGSQVIMAGNPTALSGTFYNAFHANRSNYHLIHISSLDSPRVDPAYGPTMAAKWGEDSDIYRVRVLGEFPRAESDSFISLDLVERAVERWYNGGHDEGVCELGCDVARFGDDKTVFCVRKGGRVVHLESHNGWSTTKTAGRCVQLIKEFGCTAAKIDDTGVGGGVTDNLRESSDMGDISNCQIVAMNFGGEGNNDYHNAVSIWYGILKDMLKANELALPDDETLIAQLTTRKFSLTNKGRIMIERKEDMKKRGLQSPDSAEAVALAFAQKTMAPSIINLDSLPALESELDKYDPMENDEAWN